MTRGRQSGDTNSSECRAAHDETFHNYLSALVLKICAELVVKVSERQQGFLLKLHFIASCNRFSFECATAVIKSALASCRLFAAIILNLPVAAARYKLYK